MNDRVIPIEPDTGTVRIGDVDLDFLGGEMAFAEALAEAVDGDFDSAFGHAGEGNLHLNVLSCDADQEAAIYAAMMELIAAHGGNVSSEHGVGTLKRSYLGMSRDEVLRAVTAAPAAAPAGAAPVLMISIDGLRPGDVILQSQPIYGGTDQVQRNIIGERVLGLPKER